MATSIAGLYRHSNVFSARQSSSEPTERRSTARVVNLARFNFLSEAQIWYNRSDCGETIPSECENVVVLSEDFYREIIAHPIPTDLGAVKVLVAAPAVLRSVHVAFIRCFTAQGEERIPIFGSGGLTAQLGSVEYSRPRRFRAKLEQWLDVIRTLWPDCPARISKDGLSLFVRHASAVIQTESDRMVKALRCRAKSDRRSSGEIAELHRLVSATSGPRDRNNLDAEELRRIERALLNSRKSELICLYRCLLAEVDIEREKTHIRVGTLRIRMLQVSRRVIASIVSCVSFSDRITFPRRNDHDRAGYHPSESDSLS